MSYSQRGGSAGPRPYRYFHANATPFQPCQLCGGVNPAPPQQGGGQNIPLRYFNPEAKPFSPCGCGKQGIRRMESSNTSDFKGNAYYNDFPEYPVYNDVADDYNGSGCTAQANEKNLTTDPTGQNKMAQVIYYQTGGFPTGAQFEVFSEGNEPLKYNYNLADNFNGLPVFQKVPDSRFTKRFF